LWSQAKILGNFCEEIDPTDKIAESKYSRYSLGMNKTKADSRPIDSPTDQKIEHFRQKAQWKREPGNHFLPGEPTPMDGFELVTKPQADLVLDWA